jgi:hypothetical protein
MPARGKNIPMAGGINEPHQAYLKKGRWRSRCLFAPALASDLADPRVKLWAVNTLGGFSAHPAYRSVMLGA